MMLLLLSHKVVSDSLWPPGLQPTRLLCPWNSPGKNTGVGCHFFLHGIFPTQGSNPSLLCLLHWQTNCLPLSYLGSPCLWICTIKIDKAKRWHLGQCAWFLVSNGANVQFFFNPDSGWTWWKRGSGEMWWGAVRRRKTQIRKQSFFLNRLYSWEHFVVLFK